MPNKNAAANWLARLALVLFPPREGQSSTTVDTKVGLNALSWIGLAVVVGAVGAAAVVLLHYGVPGVPYVIWGLVTGLVMGAGIAFVVAARNPVAKGGGAFMLLTVPALVFLLPAALVYAVARGVRDRFARRRARPVT